MPHLTLEVSKHLPIADETELLLKLNTALYQSGQFKHSKDIKSRLYRTDGYLIGFGNDGTHQDGEHFVVAHLCILKGRSDEIKAELVGCVMAVLQSYISPHVAGVQYAVNLTELADVYQKAIV